MKAKKARSKRCPKATKTPATGIAPAAHVPNDSTGLRVIRPTKMKESKGISKSRAYDMNNPKSPRHDPTFPRPVPLGSARATGWLEHELDAWLQRQIAAHRRNA